MYSFLFLHTIYARISVASLAEVFMCAIVLQKVALPFAYHSNEAVRIGVERATKAACWAGIMALVMEATMLLSVITSHDVPWLLRPFPKLCLFHATFYLCVLAIMSILWIGRRIWNAIKRKRSC